MTDKYLLQVTAGPSYDRKSHRIVAVNSPQTTLIESENISVKLNVRIKSYRGLPFSSPRTSPYFSTSPHASNQDQYSISFAFKLTSTINGDHLVFGNDFDNPIRHRLPPGFNTAMRIVKWFIDPGIDGEVYGDKPYIYGPAVSSINTLYVGGMDSHRTKESIEEGSEIIYTEGGCDEGRLLRKEKGIPDTETKRKKFFLNQKTRINWDWKANREYGCDFFNPYLDFNEFALHLPGFTLPIMKYWDGQPLRYVLKNRANDMVLFVIEFTLHLKEDVNEHGIPNEYIGMR